MTTLLLFDVDGTLTHPRKIIEEDMLSTLKSIKNNPLIDIGFVGGSDINKQIEQLHQENFHLFDWRFSENGLYAYHKKECIHKRSFVESMGENHFKEFINICLGVLASLDCPIKRGTFIEFRNGMINISPIGRSCSQIERDNFYDFDVKNNVRQEMIEKIKLKWEVYIFENNLKDLPEITFSIGGQISVDVFPKGWDKTYCLKFVETTYDKIHFFGDKTMKGGNDYEIYNDPRVIGHHVNNYKETIEQLAEFI